MLTVDLMVQPALAQFYLPRPLLMLEFAVCSADDEQKEKRDG